MRNKNYLSRLHKLGSKLAFALILAMLSFLAPPASAATQNSMTTVNIEAQYYATVNGTTVQLPLSVTNNLALTNGIGINQAATVYSTTGLTIAGGGNTVLDLNGVLTDFTGAVISFTKVRAIYVKSYAANTGVLSVGGAGANAFVGAFGSTTDVVKVNPGGVLLMYAPDANGYTVTPATGDLLKIANAGGSTDTLDVVIIGI